MPSKCSYWGLTSSWQSQPPTPPKASPVTVLEGRRTGERTAALLLDFSSELGKEEGHREPDQLPGPERGQAAVNGAGSLCALIVASGLSVATGCAGPWHCWRLHLIPGTSSHCGRLGGPYSPGSIQSPCSSVSQHSVATSHHGRCWKRPADLLRS